MVSCECDPQGYQWLKGVCCLRSLGDFWTWLSTRATLRRSQSTRSQTCCQVLFFTIRTPYLPWVPCPTGYLPTAWLIRWGANRSTLSFTWETSSSYFCLQWFVEWCVDLSKTSEAQWNDEWYTRPAQINLFFHIFCPFQNIASLRFSHGYPFWWEARGESRTKRDFFRRWHIFLPLVLLGGNVQDGEQIWFQKMVR